MIDASSVRVHRHAATEKQGSSRLHGPFLRRPDRQDHGFVDADGLPISLKLKEGHAQDGLSATDMLGDIGTGQILIADWANNAESLRATLATRDLWSTYGASRAESGP